MNASPSSTQKQHSANTSSSRPQSEPLMLSKNSSSLVSSPPEPTSLIPLNTKKNTMPPVKKTNKGTATGPNTFYIDYSIPANDKIFDAAAFEKCQPVSVRQADG